MTDYYDAKTKRHIGKRSALGDGLWLFTWADRPETFAEVETVECVDGLTREGFDAVVAACHEQKEPEEDEA